MALNLTNRYAVDSGATGADLVALLAAHDDVSAIICDNQLAGENGIDIHARVETALRDRKIAFFLLHGSGATLRDKHGAAYFLEHQIVEIHKPMRSILAITGIVDAEVARLRT